MGLHTGVYGHLKRVCAESWLWEKNPLLHWGVELASAACRPDALPAELHPHQQADLHIKRERGRAGHGEWFGEPLPKVLACEEKATTTIIAINTAIDEYITGWLATFPKSNFAVKDSHTQSSYRYGNSSVPVINATQRKSYYDSGISSKSMLKKRCLSCFGYSFTKCLSWTNKFVNMLQLNSSTQHFVYLIRKFTWRNH